MCILYGNVVLRIACTVRRVYTLYLKREETLSIIETYNKFKAKFLPENRHKTSNEIAQRKLGQSINNILIKIFQKTNKKAEKICKTFAELQKYFVGRCGVRNPI